MRSEVNKAVDDVSFDILPGETLGLVERIGLGQSTLGRVVVGLLPRHPGRAHPGQSVAGLRGKARKALVAARADGVPGSLLVAHPKMTVEDALADRCATSALRGEAMPSPGARRARCLRLSASAMTRYPREFSGGQAPAFGIARALIVRPNFIVADEPVSALDVSIRRRSSTCCRI